MEDFVPYKLAVKLKQKGFKQGYNIFGYRLIFSDENTIRFVSDIGAYDKEYFGENIAAPTISQVLKWLREEKQIEIVVLGQDYIGGPYFADAFTKDGLMNKAKPYPKYEQAAIAEIEYCLDNLI